MLISKFSLAQSCRGELRRVNVLLNERITKMRFLIILTLSGMAMVHAATFFDVKPPALVVWVLSGMCMFLFIYGVFGYNSSKKGGYKDLIAYCMANLSLKKFLFGLIVVVYFALNFFISMALGGITEEKDGIFYWVREVSHGSRRYIEIDKAEYDRRVLHQIRGFTGHPFFFAVLGSWVILLGQGYPDGNSQGQLADPGSSRRVSGQEKNRETNPSLSDDERS